MAKARRRKMSLADQAAFLHMVASRCVMKDEEGVEHFAGDAWLRISDQDAADLKTIAQTLAIFEVHAADIYVRDKIERRRRK